MYVLLHTTPISSRKVRAAASIRDRRSPAHEVAASKPLEKEEAVGAPMKPAVMSGAALAAVSALAATPAALAVAEMPSPAGTMGGALPALATILFVFIPVAFLIILYVKTAEPAE